MHFRQLLKLYVIDIHGRDAGLRMDFCRAKKKPAIWRGPVKNAFEGAGIEEKKPCRIEESGNPAHRNAVRYGCTLPAFRNRRLRSSLRNQNIPAKKYPRLCAGKGIQIGRDLKVQGDILEKRKHHDFV